jgi:hypothetical protein
VSVNKESAWPECMDDDDAGGDAMHNVWEGDRHWQSHARLRRRGERAQDMLAGAEMKLDRHGGRGEQAGCDWSAAPRNRIGSRVGMGKEDKINLEQG